MSIRDKKEAAAERKLKKMYGLCIYERFEESLQIVAEHLGEEPLEEKTPRKQSLKEYFEEHRTTQKKRVRKKQVILKRERIEMKKKDFNFGSI